MRQHVRVMGRTLALALFATMGSSAAANAASITFTGSTDGCFVGGTCTPGGDSTLAGLAFADATFNVTSSPSTPGIAGPILGSFTLDSTAATYTGLNQFNLTVAFTAPPSTPTGTTYSANLLGSVSSVGGAVLVTFGAPAFFTVPGGSFTLQVNNVTVHANNVPVELTGTILEVIQQTSVPEPASALMLGLGLVGTAFVRRRVVSI